MFASVLHELIPGTVNRFAKLKRGEPYHFDRWETDQLGSPCLYYWFRSRDGVKKNKKRLPISEIRAALLRLRSVGVLTREAFRQVCPTAESAGPCGFAVVGRILESLDVAVYWGREGFKLTNPNKATALLAIQPSCSEAR
jgi:hypothetical protein